MNQPRAEYPRPQFVREEWINLNGPWSYTFDFGRSGLERKLHESTGFAEQIIVPFCPESSLSGVAHHDFIPVIWYQREISVPRSWAGQRILLHFGAVDFECEVWIDGQSVGRHVGGSSSFCFDITRCVAPGQLHSLVVQAIDDTRSPLQPCGKQSHSYYSRRCHYTRVTGIWQTVWLEAVHPAGLLHCRIVPDIDSERCTFIPRFQSIGRHARLTVQVHAGDELVATAKVPAADGMPLSLAIPRMRPWSPDDPFLYDLTLSVEESGSIVDTVRSYMGMRKIQVEGDRVLLNNQPLYQRLVLDQGFYKEGIWTAPTDAHLKQDIELAMAAGFNGARLHQKVFEERFLYWADHLGYLVWGEYPSWGFDTANSAAQRNVLQEWSEIVERDANHPAIITWTPLNETHLGKDPHDPARHQAIRLHHDLYDLTKRLDPTRPVNEASGYTHQKTDLWTVHNYCDDPPTLRETLMPGADGKLWRNYPETEVDYGGQPYLIDEFGGIRWVVIDETAFSSEAAWGYGKSPESIEDLYARLAGLVRAVVEVPHIRGFCYTQLTDVEQEQNGIYNYDRSVKFDMARIREIFQLKP